MNTPEELRDWAEGIEKERPYAPTKDVVCEALRDYAELLDDMQTLTRILHKWGP